MSHKAFTSLLLAVLVLPAFTAAWAYDEETDIRFQNAVYPIEVKLPAAQKAGAVLFETPFSEAPAADYDTVLVQGFMPDPAVRLDFTPRSSTLAACVQTVIHRFPNGRFWAKYRCPAGRQPVRLSVVNLGVNRDATLTLYGAELLKAETMKEGAAAAISTFTYVPDPKLSLPDTAPFKVIRRADWKALPPTADYTPHSPFFFTLHHTQAHYPKTLAESVAEMQFIQDFHQNGRGWIDIAYHFLIDPMGNVFEGRPIKAMGAHVLSHNNGNVGISIMGNYHPPVDNVFTDSSRDSFVAVGRYLKDTYEVGVSSFYAHRDIGNTDCPGDDLYAKKTLLRDLIFTPQPQAVPVIPSDPAAPLTPNQNKSLQQLLQYLK
jgi:hypothetical protein